MGKGEEASSHRHELTLFSKSVSSKPSAARKERLTALEREKKEESERGVTERVVPLVSALFEEKERERTRQTARERDLRTRKSPVEAALHSAHSSTPTPTTPRSTANSISPRHQGPSPTSKAVLRHQGGTQNLRALSSTPPGAQFTCFTNTYTETQILTPACPRTSGTPPMSRFRSGGIVRAGGCTSTTVLACYYSTKVQILTQLCCSCRYSIQQTPKTSSRF